MSSECHKCSTDCFLSTLHISSVILFYTSNASMLLVLLKIHGVIVIILQLMHYLFSILKISCIYAIHASLTSLRIYLHIYTISELTINTLSDITAKLDDIISIVDNINICTITNTHKKTFADALKNSIDPKLNTISDKINKSGNHSNSTKL